MKRSILVLLALVLIISGALSACAKKQEEVGGELEDRSLLCDEAVGPGFDDESVDVFGPHLAPEALRGLDDRHVDPGLEEVVGGDEPGDPASHHYDGADLRHLPWLRSRRRTGRRSGRDGR